MTQGVICYGKTKCPCVFDVPDWGLEAGKCQKLDAIIIKHERGHFGHVECNQCGLYRPEWKKGVDRLSAECKLREQTINDLKAAIPQETRSGCKKVMKKYLDATDEWVWRVCYGRPRPKGE